MVLKNTVKTALKTVQLGESSPVKISQTDFLKLYRRILQQTIVEYEKILQTGIISPSNEMWVALGVSNPKSDRNLSEADIKNLANQAAYLILNKILSYHMISLHVARQYSIHLTTLYNSHDSTGLFDQLSLCFQEISDTYEFAPIFAADSLFAPIKFSQSLSQRLIEFIDQLSAIDVTEFGDDFIAELFQILIPIEKRKALGQIYTPGEIAEVMSLLAIRSSATRVLDPSCGCGTLLRKCYHRVKALSVQEGVNLPHRQLLEQIWGVEINHFPAHLAMMTLAFQDLSAITETAGVLIEDFLDMGPLQKYNVRTKDLKTGRITSREMVHKFDAIIANPPYIKQEKIPNKKLMMKNLPKFASYRASSSISSENSDSKPKSKGVPKVKLNLTGKTDYYGFFLWYSTYFLKDQGLLCFLIPNKWLDVKYGENLKHFLLDRYQIRALISYDKNIFKNAQVSTVLLVAQKESRKSRRDQNIIRFIHLSRTTSPQIIEQLTYSPLNSSIREKLQTNKYIYHNEMEGVHSTYIPQKLIDPEEKWSHKYFFQSEFAQLFDECSLIGMDNHILTSVVGGIKTGANDFFFPSPKHLQEFGIEKEFLKSGIKTGRKIPKKTLISATSDIFLSVPANTDIDLYPGLSAYVQHGDRVKNYPKRPSVNWKPWYSIPEGRQDSPDILFLRHIDKKFDAKWNQIHAIVADGVRGLNVMDPAHSMFYLGVCNSTFFYWQAHIRGRWEGQGDLQLLVYELKRFQIPDIRNVSPAKIKAVEDAMQELLQKSEVKKDSCIKDKSFLDKTVLAAMGLEHAYDLLCQETQRFEDARLSKKF